MAHPRRTDILKDLQADILRMQGFKSFNNPALDIGLGPIKDFFPNSSFPLGAIHEFLCSKAEDSASTIGFIAGLLSSLMGNKGATLWISSSRTLFPPALKSFGIEPDRFVFLDLEKERDVVWAMNEALKCSALSAVVGEIREIDFTNSRRLQLAVEQSQVTGFILRNSYRKLNTTACVSRWRVTQLPSESVDNLPGIGFPKWRVELLRMRNGKTGVWDIQWVDGQFAPVDHFHPVTHYPEVATDEERKAG
ncbi:MAG TPA: Error-prone repair protein ImuA [Cyclobacteriaceae bacterium]|nr:Error-prone repair protein ImuA [Cyclobacteriaceae bacterium]